MKKNVKTILFVVVAFVIGVILTFAVMNFAVMPSRIDSIAQDLTNDIARFGAETSIRSYVNGYIDGKNGDHEMYGYWNMDEAIEIYDTTEYKCLEENDTYMEECKSIINDIKSR